MQNCYNGKASQKVLEEQDERLTTKHIHTLQFMQEIARENKELKAKVEQLEEHCSKCGELHAFAENAKEKIKNIQEQYLAKADEVNRMLTEKHRLEMMKKIEDDLVRERKWEEEKTKLLAEIEKLKKEIFLLREKLEVSKEHKGQVEILQLKVEALQNEVDRLNNEANRKGHQNKNQLTEIQRLQFVEEQNENLKGELNEMIQKNKELQFKISKLEKDLSDQKVSEQDELLDSLREKIKKVLTENKALEKQHTEDLDRFDELNQEGANLRKALGDSEKMRTDLRRQMEEMMQEILHLRKQLSVDRDKQTFRDFVRVKRELQLMQAENEDLRSKLRLAVGGKGLPSIKQTSSSSTSVKSLDSLGSGSKGRKKDSGYASQYPPIPKGK